IRQAAVGFRKENKSEAELDRLLNALDISQTMEVVRAFSFFSHLLNIAEDEQQHRRRRAHAQAGAPRRPGSLSHALDEVKHVGFEGLMQWFGRARVSPVLTAHPTEVQRQSILECEREIARLIAQPQSGDRDEAIHAEVLRLWLTSMLRFTRLQVADEVTNGVNYFRLTFLQELPRLYAEFEQALKERFALGRSFAAPAGRALPARDHRHLRAPRRHVRGARRRAREPGADPQGNALRGARGVRRRAKDDLQRAEEAGRRPPLAARAPSRARA